MARPRKGNRRPGHVIFRAWRRGPNGEILYARDYGYKAWPIRLK